MRVRVATYPPEVVFKRIESITPRGGSMGYTLEYVATAAFNLADGTITLDEFMHAVKIGPDDKRAPKTPKPAKTRVARKPPAPRKNVDPTKNPWD